MEEVFCGCVGHETCEKSVEIPKGQHEQIKSNRQLIIVDGCPNGLFKGDKVVESKPGFRIVQSIG